MILMTFIILQTSILLESPKSLYFKSSQWRYFSLYSFAYLSVSAEVLIGSEPRTELISGHFSGTFILEIWATLYINSSYEEF